MRILNLSYTAAPNLPGHEMMHMSVNSMSKQFGWEGLIAEAKNFNPDLIIEREWNDSVALYNRLYAAFPDVPKAWWWIDAHVLFKYRIPYAKNFDYLFMAVSKFVEPATEQVGRPAFWLPLSCPWDAGGCFKNDVSPKEYHISFIARAEPAHYFKRRRECIRIMEDHFGDRFHFETTGDMVRIVRSSNVSINCAYNQDLNFRVFEVLGCGTELVTDPVPDLYAIPGLQERLTLYEDFDDLIAKVEAVLCGDIRHDMEEVQNWIRSNHCVEHRYQQIVDILKQKGVV